MLLPHGYEGQGPEHSSARLERFLQQGAEENMIVANFTTPANYFHALRRQMKRDIPKPLVIMTPKSLLRHPLAVSTADELENGKFNLIYPGDTDPEKTRRVVFCTGKVYYDALAAREEKGLTEEVALVRVEQLYPFPTSQVKAELERYANTSDIVWLQEEPRNMGAAGYLKWTFEEFAMKYITRGELAASATGFAKMHAKEQQNIIDAAFNI